jgi:DNA-binding transcriptional regulator GbsR (MarR family)
VHSVSPDSQLEALLKVLVERFGASRTLGEVYATTNALRAVREGRDFTLAEVADQTGISKQNLSRWLKIHIETGHAVIQPHQEDGRRQSIDVVDLKYACRHLPAIADVLGCAVDPTRDERLVKTRG